jgi:ABC-type glycerol-3-phosphate transport system substrate-binding protein
MRSITRLYDRPDDVPRNYRPFRDSVLGLGQWMMTVREHALVLDRIIITAPSEQPPNIKEDNFLDRLWVILIGFINSFITSYSMLSEDLEGDFVTVWIGGATGGRDQALAFNQIIVRDFTSVRRGADNKHIPVNLQLVGTGVILVATLAGRGPDLTLSVGVGDPVNFALRSAVEDLTQFPDFWEVTERFFPGTLTPFMLDKEDGNGVGVYALPETAVFPMLFYRTDVLQDIGVDPDELRTWQSIIEMYPELLAQNMEFGLPSTFGTFMMFMYQMEIELYRDGYVAANLDDPRSLEAFRFFTDFYLEFSMPRDYDFANRFRTGEMPVAIADYTQFNLISIFAPELRGRWNMVPVPGFEQICPVTQEMIGINAIVPIGVGGAIMMANSRLKDDAWEFLKWWTDADAQFNFGRQLEAVMGGAARWNTANMEAFERMPWTAEIRQNLATQIGLMQNDMPERFMVGDIVPGFGLKGVPEVPGGYYTGRHFDFARNDVLNDNVNDRQDPRQRLLRAVIYINNEITRRREEFNMSLTEDEWRRRNN